MYIQIWYKKTHGFLGPKKKIPIHTHKMLHMRTNYLLMLGFMIKNTMRPEIHCVYPQIKPLPNPKFQTQAISVILCEFVQMSGPLKKEISSVTRAKSFKNQNFIV